MSNWVSPDEGFGDELRSLGRETDWNDDPTSDSSRADPPRVEERRWANRSFLYGCPDPGCGWSYVYRIDREAVTCSVCDKPLRLVDTHDRTDHRLLRFACDEAGHTTKTHKLDLRMVRCSVHDEPMWLTGSSRTPAGTDEPAP